MGHQKRLRTGDDWSYSVACGRKRGYPTENQARKTARYQIQMGQAPSGKLWPYACPACRKWHLTHKMFDALAVTKTQLREGFY